MARDVLRFSQVVGVFGPGAMVDLPDRSVLVCGLDRWNMRGKDAFQVVEEPRLSDLLKGRLRDARIAKDKGLTLRTPPVDPDDAFKPDGPGVEVLTFPTWFACDAVTPASGPTRGRRMVQWNELAPPARKKYPDEDTGRQLDVTPVRFVCGCEDGHLQDVDWRWVVHGGAPCPEAMWLEETGTSADPRDTRVICGCGRAISLEQLFQPGRLGKCRGARPWIGRNDPSCAHSLRLLTRTATNTYFPQVARVISLPRGDDALSRRVNEHWSDLHGMESPAEVRVMRKGQKLGEALKGYSDEEVFAAIQRLRESGTEEPAADPRIEEFDLLASGRPIIGENRPDALLHAETLPRNAWDPDRDTLVSGIAALVAVHRLREVACLYGFTRFEPAATAAKDGLEDVGLAVRGAPLGENPDWLPAIVRFGEGLFLQFEPDSIRRWCARAGATARGARLSAGHAAWARRKRIRAPEDVGLPYRLIHSLSHVLMTEIALRMRLPLDGAVGARVRHPAPARRPRPVGLLIYTASAGTQGTLGGLVAIAGRFRLVLGRALERLALCSNDPVCADHDPAASTDDRALHGAACHGCLLIAETSCEARNLFLDRALLVPTMADTDAAFF